jgi:hypothetical protein
MAEGAHLAASNKSEIISAVTSFSENALVLWRFRIAVFNCMILNVDDD